ncbi:MAG: recombinase A [Polyangiaceae bacterium]|nr:recombinase A [Polyangiaceae bacterium]
MFSISAVLGSNLRDFNALEFARLGVVQGIASLSKPKSVLHLGPELDHVLPDHGLPPGVVELAAPVGGTKGMAGAMRGGATTIALAAARTVHEGNARAWCAWVNPTNAPSLYAPSVAQAGIDLDRLLIVRPDPVSLARTVVRIAISGAFDLVIVDALSGLSGNLAVGSHRRPRVDGSVVVRKLALASEESGTRFLLLTNASTSRPLPWPVALRVSLPRR